MKFFIFILLILKILNSDVKKTIFKESSQHKISFNKKKSVHNSYNEDNFLNKNNIPSNLIFSILGNFTKFEDFQISLKRIKVNSIQSKELFHIVDMNDDKTIQDSEWKNFYNLFIIPFRECDSDENNLLDNAEGISCIQNSDIFSNMLSFHSQWISSMNKFYSQVFKAFDLDHDGFLNLYDYVMLRNYNNAYDILLAKESKIYFNNFEIGMHLINKNIKFYDHLDFVRIYNRTIKDAYFPSKEYMDFATFSTLGNLFKLFVSNKYDTAGYLSYSDLLSVGGLVQTYKLIQNYTQLFVKNHLIYENLNRGLKMKNLIFQKDNKNIYPSLSVKFQNNFDKIRDTTKKISIEQFFLLYRNFEVFDSHDYSLPFTLSFDDFEVFLSENFFKGPNELIESSFIDFQKVSQASSKKFEKKDYLRIIFNILDMNNSTFLEIYEIMLLSKSSNLFSWLSVNGKIINENNNTIFISNLTQNFSDYNILTLGDSESDYLKYINYKFNFGKINFHQFLFSYLLRLKDTSHLITPDRIMNFLNASGFSISEDELIKFYDEYDIKPDGFLSFNLALQNLYKFYSNNLS